MNFDSELGKPIHKSKNMKFYDTKNLGIEHYAISFANTAHLYIPYSELDNLTSSNTTSEIMQSRLEEMCGKLSISILEDNGVGLEDLQSELRQLK